MSEVAASGSEGGEAAVAESVAGATTSGEGSAAMGVVVLPEPPQATSSVASKVWVVRFMGVLFVRV